MSSAMPSFQPSSPHRLFLYSSQKSTRCRTAQNAPPVSISVIQRTSTENKWLDAPIGSYLIMLMGFDLRGRRSVIENPVMAIETSWTARTRAFFAVTGGEIG